MVNFLVGCTIQIEPHLSVVLVDFFEFAPLEERLFDQQDMKDDASRKHVADWAGLLPLGKSSYLWGDVSRSPASVEDVVLALDIGG